MEDTHYSSDDDVAWGPLTIREIKRDFRSPPIVTKGRRTEGPKLSKRKEELDIRVDDLTTIINDVSKLSMSSKFFTPNSSWNTKRKEDSEQVPLNLTSADTTRTSYYSLDHLEHDHELTKLSHNVRPSNFIHNFNASLISLESDEDISTNNLQEIIEKLDEDIEESCINTKENISRFKGLQSQYEDISEVYEDSSTESTPCVDKRYFNQSLSCAFTESANEDKSVSQYARENSIITRNITRNESAAHEENSMFEKSVTENKSEEFEINLELSKENKDEYKFNITDDSVYETDNAHFKSASTVYTEEKNSIVQHELETYEDSNTVFDDTLEEMERLLKYGLNYTMPDDEIVKKLEKPPKVTHTRTPTPSKLKQPVKYHNVISPISEYIKRGDFKVPMKPVPKSSPLLKSRFYQNIKSPVALYIKNTPTAALQQNHMMKAMPKSKLPAKLETMKENIELPLVVYKPAATRVKLFADQKSPMPAYMNKGLSNCKVVKHDRFESKKNESYIANKLENNDLTMNASTNNTLLNGSENMSILTSKNAYIE